MVKDFFSSYIKATQLVNMYLKVEKMANNRRVNDLLTNESTRPPSEVRDKPKPSRNKRPIRTIEMKRIEDEVQDTLAQISIPMNI